MKLFDDSLKGIEKKLDLNYMRHLVLSGNLANAETPGYRAREVNFAGELERALGASEDELVKTNSKHMDINGADYAHVVFDNVGAVKADGNNVDLDISMGKLSTNANAYENAANLLAVKLRMLKDAALGRAIM